MKTSLIRLQFILTMALVSQALGQSYVDSVSPKPNALNVPKSTNITISFNTDIDVSSLGDSTIKVNGSQSGLRTGKITNSGARIGTFDPDSDFKLGEVVTVTLTTEIKNNAGDPMASSYTWSFTIESPDGTSTFASAGTPGVGDRPFAVTTGDFDDDGDLDLAVANYNSNNVSILKNDGGGVFTQQSPMTSVGNNPRSVTAGDFDGDGDLDLAVANLYSNNVSILKNDRSGGFIQQSPRTSVGNNPSSVTAGDFDGDGNLDLAVANYGLHKISILKNDRSGGFTQQSPKTSVGNYPSSVIAGDFDGDGDLDLAVANYGSHNISILKNDRSGGFTKQSPETSVGNYPYSVTAGDFDGDGDSDLAVANDGSKNVSILKNNGSGVFTQTSQPGVASNPQSLTAGDFDGDGDLDLAVANYSSNKVSILKNDGGGVFTQQSQTPGGSLPESVTAGDFDGDGDLDLAVANSGSDNVSILKNRPKAPVIALLADSLNFETLKSNASKSLTFQIINEGGLDPLQVTDITSSNNAFKASPAAGIIKAVDTLKITVTFTPTEARVYNDSLTISSNDSDEPKVRLYLRGIGALIFISSTPNRNSHTARPETDISATLNGKIQIGTIQDAGFRAFGEASGKHAGAFSYNSVTKTATLNPDNNFVIGEKVQVTLTPEIKSAPDSTPLLDGYVWKFSVGPLSGSGKYNLDPTSYTPGSKPFAVAVGDFNKDGYSDFVVANNGGLSVFINNKSSGFNLPIPLSNQAYPEGV